MLRRSKTAEAATILRLAAALREAMQVSAGAFALLPAGKHQTHLLSLDDRDELTR
jgi:hypothetical protein